jgi:hypothetical protein
MRMPQNLNRSANRDSRRAERIDVAFPAFLREPGLTKFQIKVIDLSSKGFRCETSFTMVEGTTVWLTIPGLAGIEARIAWRDKFLYGCSFVTPLHVAVFDHIARLYPPNYQMTRSLSD